MQSTSQIREVFLNFFSKKGHETISSGPLVPQNDPTLLFTNSGMVQFKNVFIGQEKREILRATTSQKCVRAGGKHNDLENVGYTARHHTFFEMLGNFSFGDYFKDTAIELAWTLVTKEFGLSKDRLFVTVFAEDEEAHRLWRSIGGLSEDRIIRISTSDNFWSMGDTGPCGPCSEIFYDHGEHIPGGLPGSHDEDGDRFIEIWNLVFMQFETLSDGTRIDLPKPSIDTGMGLERISAVLQGTHDNYETDLFKNLIHASIKQADLTDSSAHDMSHRVIADHLRSSSFLIADGVLPSNEGRGYVLRRIMRRAMRHVHLMGCKEPLLYRLVPVLINEMGQAFPELRRAQSLITESLEAEERRFRFTLDRGLSLLEAEIGGIGEDKRLSGQIAFKLYDTYGFPLDLTQDALRKEGISVDIDGFEKEMQRQKREARAAWKGGSGAVTEPVWFNLYDKYGATEFLGYNKEFAEGQIVGLLVDGKIKDELSAGDEAAIVLNQTPFYGMSGGQEGDKGIISAENSSFEVFDTQKKLGDLYVHMGKMLVGGFKSGDYVNLDIDVKRRRALKAHHSATHLLHSSLRNLLGDHVSQKGSLVAEDRLRFDISHPTPIDEHELFKIEQTVNELIYANSEVETRLMTLNEATDAGAIALFGEKYDDEVRVVSMGESEDKRFSVELCGGTHVNRTGDIGYFKLIGESGVASGVRRIEAVTGKAAESYIQSNQRVLDKITTLLKVPVLDVPGRLELLLEEKRSTQEEVKLLRREVASGRKADSNQDVKQIGKIKFIGRIIDNVPPNELKSLTDDLKTQIGEGVIALLTANESKASLVVGVTSKLERDISAVDLVNLGSKVLGGNGGGGRPDMAQAGGPDTSKLNAVLLAIEKSLGEIK